MRTTDRIICVLVAVAFVAVAPLSIKVVAGEQKRPGEVMKVMNRIDALGRTTNLSEAEKLKRLEQLEAVGREVVQKWRKRDVETYARLTLRVCGTLTSVDFGTRRRFYLARSFAVKALEKADEIPLNAECSLVAHVPPNVDAEGEPVVGEAWSALRRKQARLWLHAWQRIEKAIDKTWDPNDYPELNVAPPKATGFPPGVAPSAIADPRLRAEYEAAIEANRRKNARYKLQSRARKLQKRWIPRAERFIIRAYMQPPAGKAELKELRLLLHEYIPDAARRARLLEALEKKGPGDPSTGVRPARQ